MQALVVKNIGLLYVPGNVVLSPRRGCDFSPRRVSPDQRRPSNWKGATNQAMSSGQAHLIVSETKPVNFFPASRQQTPHNANFELSTYCQTMAGFPVRLWALPALPLCAPAGTSDMNTPRGRNASWCSSRIQNHSHFIFTTLSLSRA